MYWQTERGFSREMDWSRWSTGRCPVQATSGASGQLKKFPGMIAPEMFAMVMISDYIVLLWMAPAMVLLIMPITIFTTAALFKAARSLAVTMRRAFTRRNNRQSAKGEDTRQSGRISILGLRADISDSMTSCTGLVANISRMGLCLKDVPERFSISRSFLSINIHGRSANYRLVARPRWERFQSVRGKTIGLEIARAPDNWDEFLVSH